MIFSHFLDLLGHYLNSNIKLCRTLNIPVCAEIKPVPAEMSICGEETGLHLERYRKHHICMHSFNTKVKYSFMLETRAPNSEIILQYGCSFKLLE